ncbi:MAG TPA: hypothetical protein VGR38_00345 [Candidatus Polarisedimenticolia bacterium]|nr:hypothetical protein [Candidatus Polarisedimenticolia bacterium]
MRGASALGQLIARYPQADVRVLVVWEPVIPSDTGPPTRSVRKPLFDPRVVEFWDEHRWLSPRMIERAAIMAREHGEEAPLGPEDIAWDIIAMFPGDSSWAEPFPIPSWYGEQPVVHSLGPVEETLKKDASPPDSQPFSEARP